MLLCAPQGARQASLSNLGSPLAHPQSNKSPGPPTWQDEQVDNLETALQCQTKDLLVEREQLRKDREFLHHYTSMAQQSAANQRAQAIGVEKAVQTGAAENSGLMWEVQVARMQLQELRQNVRKSRDGERSLGAALRNLIKQIGDKVGVEKGTLADAERVAAEAASKVDGLLQDVADAQAAANAEADRAKQCQANADHMVTEQDKTQVEVQAQEELASVAVKQALNRIGEDFEKERVVLLARDRSNQARIVELEVAMFGGLQNSFASPTSPTSLAGAMSPASPASPSNAWPASPSLCSRSMFDAVPSRPTTPLISEDRSRLQLDASHRSLANAAIYDPASPSRSSRPLSPLAVSRFTVNELSTAPQAPTSPANEQQALGPAVVPAPTQASPPLARRVAWAQSNPQACSPISVQDLVAHPAAREPSPSPHNSLVLCAGRNSQTDNPYSQYSGSADAPKPDAAQQQTLRQIFNRVDIDGNGIINKRELIKVLRQDEGVAEFFGLPTQVRQEDGTRTRVESWFQKVDADSNREITWDEFGSFYSRGRGLSDCYFSSLNSPRLRRRLTVADVERPSSKR